MKAIVLAPIRFYRSWISPALPGACRFAPTCSSYAEQAVKTHGAWKGALLTAWRLLRCHPFHPGGYDPVPGTGGNSRFQIPDSRDTKVPFESGIRDFKLHSEEQS